MVQYVSSSSLLLAAVLFMVLQPYWATAVTYNVVNLGAKGDGHTDSTKAFLNAWAAACGSASPATIYVPPGRYLLLNAVFRGCKNHAITFRIDATLVAPSDYRVIGNAANWLAFQDVTGVSIIGGVLDGQGTGLWACKRSGKSCPSGATVCWIHTSSFHSFTFQVVMKQWSGRGSSVISVIGSCLVAVKIWKLRTVSTSIKVILILIPFSH